MIGLTVRLCRGEILVAGIISALAASGLVAGGLAIRSASDAVAECGAMGGCGDQAAALGQLLALVPWTLLASIGLAAFLGASLGGLTIAAEIEAGTAQLAWSIAASRRRWLRDRIAVLLGVLVIILLPWALAIAFLGTNIPAGNDVSVLDLYTGFGQLLGVGVVGFAAATLLGLRVDRVIPAVVGATVATWLIALVLIWAFASWRLGGAVDLGVSSGLVLVVQAVDQQGEIQTLADAALNAETRGLPFDQIYRVVELGVPFTSIGVVVAREAIAYATVAAGLLSVVFVRVRSRRPLA